MNGPHGLGGQHGFGSVDPEPEAQEPVFHDEWERRVFAMTMACGFLGQWNIDEGRYARECQHPVNYLRNTYYQNWLAGLESLLVEKGIITSEELKTGKIEGPAEGYRVPDADGAHRSQWQRFAGVFEIAGHADAGHDSCHRWEEHCKHHRK